MPGSLRTHANTLTLLMVIKIHCWHESTFCDMASPSLWKCYQATLQISKIINYLSFSHRTKNPGKIDWKEQMDATYLLIKSKGESICFTFCAKSCDIIRIKCLDYTVLRSKQELEHCKLLLPKCIPTHFEDTRGKENMSHALEVCSWMNIGT